MTDIDQKSIDALRATLTRDAESGGYNLNSDAEFLRDLVEGLLVNRDRYGYQSCPCRLASGDYSTDLDIICPCDYRDSDLAEYGACYCALYVTADVLSGKRKLKSVPERRHVGGRQPAQQPEEDVHDLEQVHIKGLPYPVWRCKVCGYLCARPQPPEICPICKVTKDRFEKFIQRS